MAPLTKSAPRPTPVRIAIADGQPIFAIGIKTLLSRHPGLQVVAETTNGDDALEVVARHEPDILLVEHHPPGLNGIEVVRRLALRKSTTRIIVLAARISDAQIQAALLHGAWGVVLKATAGDVLPGCIAQVMKGEQWIGLESVKPLVDSLRAPPGGSTLTPREVDIVKRVAVGAANKEIAARLKMSEQTVKNYLRRIFKKLQVANRVELALLAVEQQIGRRD